MSYMILEGKSPNFRLRGLLSLHNFPHKVPHDLLVFLSESETGLKVEKRISRVAVELVKQT